MIEIVYGKSFHVSARPLPKSARVKLAQIILFLKQNPFHSLLHTKPLSGALTGFYSFRITRDWRVIFQFLNPHCIQLVNVAHRKDIYR